MIIGVSCQNQLTSKIFYKYLLSLSDMRKVKYVLKYKTSFQEEEQAH